MWVSKEGMKASNKTNQVDRSNKHAIVCARIIEPNLIEICDNAGDNMECEGA